MLFSTGGGRVRGSDDVDKEERSSLKRLPGHENNLTGLAWHAGDPYFASVGLDSLVII